MKKIRRKKSFTIKNKSSTILIPIYYFEESNPNKSHIHPSTYSSTLKISIENILEKLGVPFKKAKSKYNVEQIGVTIKSYGGEFDGLSFSDQVVVKKYAKCAQIGEIFEFDT